MTASLECPGQAAGCQVSHEGMNCSESSCVKTGTDKYGRITGFHCQNDLTCQITAYDALGRVSDYACSGSGASCSCKGLLYDAGMPITEGACSHE